MVHHFKKKTKTFCQKQILVIQHKRILAEERSSILFENPLGVNMFARIKDYFLSFRIIVAFDNFTQIKK
jgi:hypothetical protein